MHAREQINLRMLGVSHLARQQSRLAQQPRCRRQSPHRTNIPKTKAAARGRAAAIQLGLELERVQLQRYRPREKRGRKL